MPRAVLTCVCTRCNRELPVTTVSNVADKHEERPEGLGGGWRADGPVTNRTDLTTVLEAPLPLDLCMIPDPKPSVTKRTDRAENGRARGRTFLERDESVSSRCRPECRPIKVCVHKFERTPTTTFAL